MRFIFRERNGRLGSGNPPLLEMIAGDPILSDTKLMLRFFRLLIEFRKRHSCLRPRSFEEGPRVEWRGAHIGAPDWSEESRSIAMHLHRKANADEEPHQIYVIANAFWEPLTFELPSLLGRG